MATATRTPQVPSSKLGEAFTTAFAAVSTKLRDVQEHATPNLGALVRATRTARGEISQMQLGLNKGKDGKAIAVDGSNKALPTPAAMGEKDKGYKKSGWFSLIANVEQGGRKTTIPPEFVTYIAAAAQVPVSQVEALVAADVALRSAATEANTPAS